MQWRDILTQADLAAFETTSKIALIATKSPEGLPHVTMISTLQGKSEAQMVWGQFSQGKSKQHVHANPETAFVIVSLDRKLWRGRAKFTHTATEGDDYEMFNAKPLFRYNTYFGISTVFYMDVESVGGPEPLPLPKIIAASLLTTLSRAGAKSDSQQQVMNPWTVNLFNAMDSLCFLAVVDDDGWPRLFPAVQTQAAGDARLVFSTIGGGDDMQRLVAGAPVAAYCMNQKLENVLVRGDFTGFTRKRGVAVGQIDVNFVYNSMPPKQGVIYPPRPLEAITEFK